VEGTTGRVTPLQLEREVYSLFEANSHKEHADGVYRFFKEQVKPLGVRSADLQSIVKHAVRRLKRLSPKEREEFFERMWQRGDLEAGVLVCHTARPFSHEYGRREFRLFERWIETHVNNWAHCDGVASWLLAACVANEPQLQAELLRWTRSRNRWKRRAAAVALLQEAKLGRSTEMIFRVTAALSTDPDVMVQKGVGWVLKEAYPKRSEAVEAFLQETSFPKLVLRIAREKRPRAG
jgi:3-methyladenine DNA glycosylase AlkD